MSLTYILFVLFAVMVRPIHGIFVLVLDPSDSPRQLASSFAKGATIQCAEALKQRLENSYQIHVTITRTAASGSLHENHAQMSNRLGAHLYIHLSFFQEISMVSHLYIYYHTYGNELTSLQGSHFYSYESAHTASYAKTKQYADSIHTSLQHATNTLYHVMPSYGIPCAPLIGIINPALMIEIGLHTAEEWHQCVQPLCDAIGALTSLC